MSHDRKPLDTNVLRVTLVETLTPSRMSRLRHDGSGRSRRQRHRANRVGYGCDTSHHSQALCNANGPMSVRTSVLTER